MVVTCRRGLKVRLENLVSHEDFTVGVVGRRRRRTLLIGERRQGLACHSAIESTANIVPNHEILRKIDLRVQGWVSRCFKEFRSAFASAPTAGLRHSRHRLCPRPPTVAGPGQPETLFAPGPFCMRRTFSAACFRQLENYQKIQKWGGNRLGSLQQVILLNLFTRSSGAECERLWESPSFSAEVKTDKELILSKFPTTGVIKGEQSQTQ